MSDTAPLKWRWTKMMTMRDLSRDDDFLSHLFVEKLGTGDVPLLVHKMDPSRRLPKTDGNVLLNIIRRLVLSKSPASQAIKQAVDDLLLLHPVRSFLKACSQQQINAFATHASRYIELYHPSGSIEISHTSRYSHRTGKSELCILATRNLSAGTVITELKGSMANLTDEEDRELKRTNLRATDNHIRRDFSVIHSRQMKKNHLFLGPARFVNHDCDHNVELFREGRYITFRVIKPIAIGQEVTAHYGDSYFGRKNRYCLCESCERKGRGGYDPTHEEESESSSDSDSSSCSSTESDSEEPDPVNFNERRTRRGVYATVRDEDQSDSEEARSLDSASALTSLSETPHPQKGDTEESPTPITTRSRASSSLPSDPATPFRSIISTRGQKARQETIQPPTAPSSKSPNKDSGGVATRASSRNATLRSTASSRSRSRVSSSCATASGDRNHGASRQGKQNGSRTDSVSRGRPAPEASSASAPAVVTRPTPAPPLCGPDGKPLPVCCTCQNILPVISIDSKVVWGLEFDSPGKKKLKQECPRCLRHQAIYGHPWPTRIASGSSIAPTPREGTPSDASRKLSHKTLPVLDRKLNAAAAASASAVSQTSHRRKPTEPTDTRPAKRRRTTSPSPMRAKETASPAAQAPQERSSKRQNGPRDDPSINVVETSEASEGVKRGRGRPRKHPLQTELPTKPTGPPNARSISARLQQQPNGRFGTKRKEAESIACDQKPEPSIIPGYRIARISIRYVEHSTELQRRTRPSVLRTEEDLEETGDDLDLQEDARSTSEGQQQKSNGCPVTTTEEAESTAHDHHGEQSISRPLKSHTQKANHSSGWELKRALDIEDGLDPREARRRKRAKIIEAAEAKASEAVAKASELSYDAASSDAYDEKFRPKPAGFLAGKLFGKPTPLSFAAKAWSLAEVVHRDYEGSDEESLPELSATQAKSARPTAFKPNPLAFARRRWASLPQGFDNDDKRETSSIPSLATSPSQEIDSEDPYTPRATPDSTAGTPPTSVLTHHNSKTLGVSSSLSRVRHVLDVAEGWGTTEDEWSSDEE